MKVAYIQPFYKATRDVFRIMMDVDVKRGELRLAKDLIPSREANVIIGATGDLSGSILYSFPKDMTLTMVKIMSGMELKELDGFVLSALGEVANIISGNAMTYLNSENYRCDISPPHVMVGTSQSLSMATDVALVIPMLSPIGEFEINVSLREADE
ncbi:MAG: chemotaxis protein CheX [Firmicutes bacterium]|nr:chemotaxis protein CheX [Bacillota bacterium]